MSPLPCPRVRREWRGSGLGPEGADIPLEELVAGPKKAARQKRTQERRCFTADRRAAVILAQVAVSILLILNFKIAPDAE
jgi:hypothetical protein